MSSEIIRRLKEWAEYPSVGPTCTTLVRDAAARIEELETVREERMSEIIRAREIIDRMTVQREHLLNGLTKILGLNTRTHYVTDSTMRQCATECLSHYRVKEIINDAFKKAGIE